MLSGTPAGFEERDEENGYGPDPGSIIALVIDGALCRDFRLAEVSLSPTQLAGQVEDGPNANQRGMDPTQAARDTMVPHGTEDCAVDSQ